MKAHEEQFGFGFEVNGRELHGTVRVAIEDTDEAALESSNLTHEFGYLLRELTDETATDELSWRKSPVEGLFTAVSITEDRFFSIGRLGACVIERTTRREVANFRIQDAESLNDNSSNYIN